jgi:hypothetical protein
MFLTLSTLEMAANLDAPAKIDSAPVTTKSELERANDDAGDAILKGTNDVFRIAFMDPIRNPSSPTAIIKSCDERLGKMIFANKANGTGTVPYYTGIYAKYWGNAVMLVFKTRNDAMASELVRNYFVEFRKRQKELDIDNKTLFSFFYNPHGMIKIEPILNDWINQLETK